MAKTPAKAPKAGGGGGLSLFPRVALACLCIYTLISLWAQLAWLDWLSFGLPAGSPKLTHHTVGASAGLAIVPYALYRHWKAYVAENRFRLSGLKPIPKLTWVKSGLTALVWSVGALHLWYWAKDLARPW